MTKGTTMNGSSSEELMQVQTLLWTHAFNHVDSQSLKCAVELGIPEAIHSHGKPIAIGDLLAALSISPCKQPQFRRVMRLLVNSGVFGESEADVYSLTPLSRVLIKNDNNVSLSGFVLGTLHPALMHSLESMSTWFRNGDASRTIFSVHHGCDFWGLGSKDPEFNKTFNEGMQSDSKYFMDVLVKECQHVFEGIRSLVDVGGGTGSSAKAISKAFPGMKCSVLDLEQVVTTVNDKDGVEFVAGNMFEHVPPTNAVLLKWVLHNWNHEQCVTILKRCKEAITSAADGGGKVVIIDQVMGFNSPDKKPNTAELYVDMLMMVLAGGIERDEQEWKKIFVEAGFNKYKITPALGLRSIIEVFP